MASIVARSAASAVRRSMKGSRSAAWLAMSPRSIVLDAKRHTKSDHSNRVGSLGGQSNFSIPVVLNVRAPNVIIRDKQWLVPELPANQERTEVSDLSRWQHRCRRQAQLRFKIRAALRSTPVIAPDVAIVATAPLRD